jgi:integrase
VVLAVSQIRDLAALLDDATRSIMLLLVLRVYEGHFDKPKTKRSVRTIPIGKETAEILERVRPSLAEPTALVFATREGLPLDRRNLLRKHVKPAAKKLGLGGVTWHLLRHSYATMLDGVGTPVGTMQSLLEHSAPEITREIYLHAIPEEQRRAVESVERLVFGPKWTQVTELDQSTSGTVN